MLIWFNRYNKLRKSTVKDYAQTYEQNEAQLVRERVTLEYDVLRSALK
ncbi:hypothetical protein M3210_09560 [Oceanobacillus luteolus]|uniref:Uncharacterized protein n=1 Tax=Oceanobacillus luteolus TaxID=1274358 RepID=A0ABW4HPZ0_9BACI|nr:hypothetical protein [Oceanobacillus luteolus]MCM3740517.1 hypothetical protein [Oceanobacillus luteolus]